MGAGSDAMISVTRVTALTDLIHVVSPAGTRIYINAAEISIRLLITVRPALRWSRITDFTGHHREPRRNQQRRFYAAFQRRNVGLEAAPMVRDSIGDFRGR